MDISPIPHILFYIYFMITLSFPIIYFFVCYYFIDCPEIYLYVTYPDCSNQCLDHLMDKDPMGHHLFWSPDSQT